MQIKYKLLIVGVGNLGDRGVGNWGDRGVGNWGDRQTNAFLLILRLFPAKKTSPQAYRFYFCTVKISKY